MRARYDSLSGVAKTLSVAKTPVGTSYPLSARRPRYETLVSKYSEAVKKNQIV